MENVKLLASSESPYCQSVKGQLLAQGVPHVTEILSWRALQGNAAVRALNPKGQVPILVHAGGALCDSLFITVHLHGPQWLASPDALIFRTAEVELRDAMNAIYMGAQDASHAQPLAGTCALLCLLLERCHEDERGPAASPSAVLERSVPVATPGILHAAFLLNATLGLLEKRGLAVPSETSHLASILSEVPLVERVLLDFGARNHFLPTGGAS